MDNIHGLTHDFHLIMVLVVNDYEGRYPVASAFVNRVDTVMLIEFLKRIREGRGPKRQIFLCQMAEQFFTA